MVKERDYSNGKIYKITSFQTDDIYIGSTCNPYLSTRFSKHKNNYKSYLNGDFNYISSFEIMKYPDAKIIFTDKEEDFKSVLPSFEQYMGL